MGGSWSCWGGSRSSALLQEIATSITASKNNEFFITKDLKKNEVLPFTGSNNDEVQGKFSSVLGFMLTNLLILHKQNYKGGSNLYLF
jgi:hypothetical protein